MLKYIIFSQDKYLEELLYNNINENCIIIIVITD